MLNTQATLLSDLNRPPEKLASVSQPATTSLRQLGVGHAAYYSPSYSVGWWNNTLQKIRQLGPGAAAGWSTRSEWLLLCEARLYPGSDFS